MSIRENVTGYVPPHKRLHPDFDSSDGERWHFNEPMQNVCCLYFNERARQVRVLLNEDELPKLSNCPYPAKLGLALIPEKGFKYCAFLYAVPGAHDADDLQAWLRARHFIKADPLPGVEHYH